MTREEALKLWLPIMDMGTENMPECKEALQMAIKALEQEPKTGHWFVDERPESDREIICSNCEQPIFKYHKMDFDYRPKYCPNCGAKMVEPQESEKI